MTRTREKLIKIVLKAVRGCDRLRAGEIVDRLIAEGVTVQECKVGDVVYCLYQEVKKETKIIDLEIDTIEIHKDYTILQGFAGEHCYRYFTKEIGKSVFLTKEQADAHLSQPPKGE